MSADRVLSGPGAEGDAAQSQGRLIGRRYRLMSPVGRGGMGMVWHAHDVLLDRAVAVKELILPYGLDQAGKQVAHRRMLREARSAARLTHPGIVTVHDVVEEDGRPWIVMELVRAWSLEQAVRQSGPLPVIQAAEIGIRVLDALRHAHAAGILHRDVKPGNVLLTADRVVLTDFGIAAIEGDVTITQTGLLMGSPAYIPPERLSGQQITQAGDLWSFGATLYAAVEGRPPYEGPDAIAVLGAVLTQEPIRPQRAGALLPVIDGLLRKNPAERLSADQVSAQLEQVLRTHGSRPPRLSDASPSLPTRTDSTPLGLLPPLEPPSGPMPSRIVETPSGPIRVPYDPLNSPSGGYVMPYDGMSSPSGSHSTQQIAFDAFASSSGPIPSGGYDALESPSVSPPPVSPPSVSPPSVEFVAPPAAPGQASAFGDPDSSSFFAGSQPSAPPSALGGPSAARPGVGEPSGPHPGPGGPSGPQPGPGAPSGPQPGLGGPADSHAGFGAPSGARSSFGGASGPQPGFGSTSGPQPAFGGPSGPHSAFGGPEGPQSAFGRASGSQPTFGGPSGPQPILPLTSDSRSTPWPLASADDLKEHSRGLSRDLGGGSRTGQGSGSRTGPATRPSGGRRRTAAEADGLAPGGRPSAKLIAGAVAAVGVVAAAVFLLTPGGSEPPAAQPPTSVPSAETAVAAVPDGYEEHTSAGMTAALPKAWKAGSPGTFNGPKDSGMKVTVQQVGPQADGGVAELGKQEAEGGVEGYIQVQLQRLEWRSWKAADWEYTYTQSNGVPMHTLTRFVTVDDSTAFKISFAMPELTWDDQADTRKVFFDTFRPAR
ncbi:protein kinase [Nonomuraea sp. NBC_01738]|uniref:serine/threonine protein kinase n=1 Tax=Nonomuraea sp. NBC_01738 TaxID=2976003 RepID=UPI002E1466F5|nr:protein kinase [Nonomuraea sp. NBC_01738]